MKRLIVTLAVVLATQVPAQVITTVKNYRENVTPSPPGYLVRGDDGMLYGLGNMLCRWQPDASGFSILMQEGFGGPLSLSGSKLYGMAANFKVCKINTDGSGFTVFGENILAGNPSRQLQIGQTLTGGPGVVLSGDTLYGWGFKINTDGTGYTELAGFPAWDGLQDWYLDFEVSGDNYFGSTSRGGLHDAGTVFRLNLDGSSGYTMNVAPGDGLGIGGWRLKAVGDTLYGYGFPDRMFKVNAGGTGYSVLRNEGFPSENLPRWGNHLEYLDGALYWVSSTFTNDRASHAICRMNTDGTDFTVLKRWSHNPASAFNVEILTVAGGGIYGVGPSNLEGVEGLKEAGGFLFRMNTDGSGFVVLHEFIKPNLFPDGFSPESLTVSEGLLYGLDSAPEGFRRLFRMNADGTGFTTLKKEALDDVDRFYPISRPTVSGSTLFGVGEGRGILQEEPYDASLGVVYRMNTDGTSYTILKEFTVRADGEESPSAALALSGSALYGMIGGNGGDGSHSGSIFKLNTDGSGYQVLRTFAPTTFDAATQAWTNSEGQFIEGSSDKTELTASGSTLYGAAPYGGQFGSGTVFKLNTDGTGITVLKHFPPETPYPRERLTLSGDTLYGLSAPTGFGAGGTVFRINTDGTGFLVLKQFPAAAWDNNLRAYTNSEGLNPIGGVALWHNTLYGTTSRGGQFGMGTLFKVQTDGAGFVVLQHLKDQIPGDPNGTGLHSLMLSGWTLYGPSPFGGDHGAGAIYRIDLRPTLSIGYTGANAVAVTWPSVWRNYVLQQNTNGPNAQNWSNLTDTIQDDGTNKTLVINPTGGSRFYRLALP